MLLKPLLQAMLLRFAFTPPRLHMQTMGQQGDQYKHSQGTTRLPFMSTFVIRRA